MAYLKAGRCESGRVTVSKAMTLDNEALENMKALHVLQEITGERR